MNYKESSGRRGNPGSGSGESRSRKAINSLEAYDVVEKRISDINSFISQVNLLLSTDMDHVENCANYVVWSGGKRNSSKIEISTHLASFYRVLGGRIQSFITKTKNSTVTPYFERSFFRKFEGSTYVVIELEVLNTISYPLSSSCYAYIKSGNEEKAVLLKEKPLLRQYSVQNMENPRAGNFFYLYAIITTYLSLSTYKI